MATIWVKILPTVSPDGAEAKKVLTKAAKAKIEKAMIQQTAAALPGNFSGKEGDKPKDKRNDNAARAVKIVEELAIKVTTKGPKVFMDGNLVVTISTLALKSENEAGEHVGEYKRAVKEIEKRGTVDKVLDALAEAFLKELEVGAFAVKPLSGSAFKTAAAQRNMPLD